MTGDPGPSRAETWARGRGGAAFMGSSEQASGREPVGETGAACTTVFFLLSRDSGGGVCV